MILNPFVLLNIKTSASKTEILKAITQHMQEQSLDLKIIADCQKILFDPEKAAAAQFFYSIENLTILNVGQDS